MMRRPSKFHILIGICLMACILFVVQMENLSHFGVATERPLTIPERLDRWHLSLASTIDLPSNCTRPLKSTTRKTKIHFHINRGCASGTLMSIFVRYGLKHGLQFVQSKASHDVHWRREFSLDEFHIPKNRTIDLFVTENVIDSELIDKMLGDKDVVHITTICRPGSALENNYYKCKLEQCFQKTLPEFVDKEDAIAISSEGLGKAKKLCPELTQIHHIVNPFGYGFGFESSHFSNFSYAMELGSKVMQRYDLVIFSDTILKDLILMRDLLGWSTDDIITFSKNSRVPSKHLNLWDLSQLDSLQLTDNMIYKQIRKQSTETIRQYDCYLKPEVQKLKALTNALKELCIIKPVAHIEENKTITGQCTDSRLKLTEKGLNEPDCFLRAWSSAELRSIRPK